MAVQSTQMTAAQAAAAAAAQNGQARNLIMSRAVEMMQNIRTNTFQPAQQNIQTINFRNVGLIKKFVVRVVGTVSNTAGSGAMTLTDFGLANFFSQIILTDYNNNQRVNTTGWHLSAVQTYKHKKPFAAGWQVETDSMGTWGETYPILAAPASIGFGTSAQVAAVFEIPCAYSDTDYRGAIFANVVNTTANLQLTVTPAAQMFVAAGADSTLAMYKGTTSATLTNVTMEVYQVYMDQLPVGQNGVVLPMLDLSTIYELKNTAFTGMSVGIDFPMPYTNFRDFLSTTVIYNSNPAGDTGRNAGTDVNNWKLQSANFTNLWLATPMVQALRSRQILGCDGAKGEYYMSSRGRVISTSQYGNMELVLNPSVAAAGAYALVGWEDFAYQQTLTTAGSLAAAGN